MDLPYRSILSQDPQSRDGRGVLEDAPFIEIKIARSNHTHE